ncbi:hypothetical protein UVI_02062760 [Ustilaginoidea virens]|uniref:Uncharacterized protein n=1 Tax=Ustilaginoidea virens TaxID=1159556 RepID=A0A1B5L7S0_USTVR|nr:hypothetical protein UVI_02062760 [Ustilaginoidea virens]
MDHDAKPSHPLPAEADRPYAPHDVLDETAKTAAVGLGSGLFLAAIRNAMSRRNVGAFAVFTRGAPVIGICARKMPVVLGLGGAVGLVQGALYFLGGRIDSFKKESDEFERKEILRRMTRLPVEQTVAEIGEGRGIHPPGYEERRRERIKQTYGFEVNPVKATVEGSH